MRPISASAASRLRFLDVISSFFIDRLVAIWYCTSMKLQDLTRKELEPIADKAGTTVAYLLQIKYGKRKPSRKLAAKIEEASGGIIDKVDLLYPDQAA